MKLILRGHHLLCLQGFQGYGYDDEFVENMIKINELRKNPDTTVKVVNTSDDICKKCPNLKDNVCESNEKNREIVSMDDEVISKLPENEEFDSVFLFDFIKDTFNSIESLDNICRNCRWWEKCKFVSSYDSIDSFK